MMNASVLSKAKQELLKDAEAAGFTVTFTESAVKVYKMSKHKTPRLVAGLVIYESGVALQMGVDLSIVKGIRSVHDMRSVLGLEKK